MISFLIEENETIQSFFEGSDDYIPSSEYMYLHTRPLLRPNFITQVNDLVDKVGHKIIRAKMNGKPVDKLVELAIVLGQQMDGEMTEEKAKLVVLALRDIRNHCNNLDKSLK